MKEGRREGMRRAVKPAPRVQDPEKASIPFAEKTLLSTLDTVTTM